MVRRKLVTSDILLHFILDLPTKTFIFAGKCSLIYVIIISIFVIKIFTGEQVSM